MYHRMGELIDIAEKENGTSNKYIYLHCNFCFELQYGSKPIFNYLLGEEEKIFLDVQQIAQLP